MKMLVGIGYVNQRDLLPHAVQSVSAFWPDITIIDNSGSREMLNLFYLASIYRPPAPLSYSQTMNLLHRFAAERGYDAVIFMHDDARAHQGTPEALRSLLHVLEKVGTKWGAVLTSGHTLTAYNMKAVREVGPWDTVFPLHFAADDYHRRLKLSGYELIETGLAVSHENGGGMTTKSDPKLQFTHNLMYPLYQKYYIAKWGGLPGNEEYDQIFNKFPLNPVKNYLSVYSPSA